MGYTLLLKKYRELRGLTQPEMAEKLDMNLSTYRTWEQGVTNITFENACRCAEILGCTPNELCNWYASHPETSSETATFSQEDVLLVERYHSLNKQGQETVNAVLDVQESVGEATSETGLMEA